MGNFIKKIAFPSQIKKQDGQILLVVILATVIALTVGLSVVSRTITNTRLSTEDANSQKALSAAEAGIEQLLSDPTAALAQSTDLSNNSSFKANAVAVEGNAFNVNDGNSISKDEGADIWLTSSPDFNSTPWNGQLSIYWTKENNDCDSAAIEIAVIEGNRGDPSMRRVTADPCTTRGNGFDPPSFVSVLVNQKPYNYSISVPVTNGFIARIIPLYENTQIGINTSAGSDVLPVQGYTIESIGSAGDTVRKLRVYQPNPRIPIEFFPYNVFLP